MIEKSSLMKNKRNDKGLPCTKGRGGFDFSALAVR